MSCGARLEVAPPVRRTLIQSHRKLAFEISDVPHVTDLEGERTT